MTIIRLDQHCETIESLIEGLENGSRHLSPLQIAQALRELNEALKGYQSGLQDKVL